MSDRVVRAGDRCAGERRKMEPVAETCEECADQHVGVVDRRSVTYQVAKECAAVVLCLGDMVKEELPSSSGQLSGKFVSSALMSVEQRQSGERRRNRVWRALLIREDTRVDIEVVTPTR